jgi:hypothetical protein
LLNDRFAPEAAVPEKSALGLLVHQWGNPGNEPLIFAAFNINPEGVAAVLPGAPAEKQ